MNLIHSNVKALTESRNGASLPRSLMVRDFNLPSKGKPEFTQTNFMPVSRFINQSGSKRSAPTFDRN